ncbi:unnamed protein product [Jaminaea pallidilutea]
MSTQLPDRRSKDSQRRQQKHQDDASSAESSDHSEDGAPIATNVQSSARSSSASLRSLRRELGGLASANGVQLTPHLDKSLAFSRNQLRNAYLRLLFHAPFTSQAHNAEMGMWADTTHRIVALYRSRLSHLEKTIKEGEAEASAEKRSKGNEEVQSGSSSAAEGGSNRPSTAPASSASKTAAKRKAQAQEYTRLAEALRNFLAREENFWKGLAQRLAVVFRLSETQSALNKAGITSSGSNTPLGPRSASESGDEGQQPAGLARLPSSPSELEPAVLQSASFPRHKERLLEVVFKVLLYCGDLARYREIYRSDPAAKDLATSRGGSGKNGRQGPAQRPRKPATPTSTERDFSAAILCYEAARLLLPSEGNTSNQLAIVATYQNDSFSAVYHYYRALCVKRSFDTAKHNLSSVLGKALDSWVSSGGIEGEEQQEEQTPASSRPHYNAELRRRCVRQFLVFQGLSFTRREFASIQPFSTRFLRTFEAAVADKALPTDVLVRIVVTGIAASWAARLWRKTKDNGVSKSSRRKNKPAADEQDPTNASDEDALAHSVETQLLNHVLGVSRVLLDICTAQTRQALEDAKVNPATTPEAGVTKNITAIMRRLLPALRISSKWCKAHLDYVDRSQGACISRAAEGFPVGDRRGSKAALAGSTTNFAAAAAAELALIQAVEDYWTSFVECVNALRFAFPFNSLPNLGTVGPTGAAALALEEDIDLRGFIPTRRGMLTQDDAAALQMSSATERESQMHPNQEQLMRIADLLVDAKVIAESEASPIVYDDARNTFRVDPAAKVRGVTGSNQREQYERTAAIQSSLRNGRPTTNGGGDNNARPAPPNNLRQPRRPDRSSSEDSNSIGDSEATEDVVDLAMKAVAAGRPGALTSSDGSNDDDEEEEEEEIIIPSAGWRRRKQGEIGSPGLTSPPSTSRPVSGAFDMAAVQTNLPPQAPIGTPMGPSSSQTLEPPFSQQQQSASPSIPAKLTAQDLLLQMINGRGSGSAAHMNANAMGSSSPMSQQRLQTGQTPQSAPQQSQALFFGGLPSATSSPSQQQPFAQDQRRHAHLASIWSRAPGEALPGAGGSALMRSGSMQASPPVSSTPSGADIWRQNHLGGDGQSPARQSISSSTLGGELYTQPISRRQPQLLETQPRSHQQQVPVSQAQQGFYASPAATLPTGFSAMQQQQQPLQYTSHWQEPTQPAGQQQQQQAGYGAWSSYPPQQASQAPQGGYMQR